MIEKAIIYATNARGLLVFREPDFPDVPLQVPGGTIGPGETPLAAAKREFFEETGLSPSGFWRHLESVVFTQHAEGQSVSVHRHFFQTLARNDLPASWDHVERHAHDGSAPVLFRFEWLSLPSARKTLSGGLGQALGQLNDSPDGARA